MWLNKKEQSKWAYLECYKIKYTKKKIKHNIFKNLDKTVPRKNWKVPEELKDLITTSEDCLDFCRYIENDFDIRSRITKSNHALEFCEFVVDDPEVRKKITNPANILKYVKCVNDDFKIVYKMWKQVIHKPSFVKYFFKYLQFTKSIPKNKKSKLCEKLFEELYGDIIVCG